MIRTDLLTRYSVLMLVLLPLGVNAQRKMDINRTFYNNSPEWVQTGGPLGGYINDIEIDPSNPTIIYAAGSPLGIYKSINGGKKWYLLSFPRREDAEIIEIDPSNTAILYCDYNNLSKSTDSAKTWQAITTGFGDSVTAELLQLDPINSSHLYMAGSKKDASGIAVYKSENGGTSWLNITNTISIPSGSDVTDLAVLGNGKLFVGIDDKQLQTWHKGKVFYSANDGLNWDEVDFGQSEDRFIKSVYANPHNLQEIWITEGSLFNEDLSQPTVYRSDDGGGTWQSITFAEGKSHILGASSDGKIYFDGPYYTNDKGNTFVKIWFPPEIRSNDMFDIAIHPVNPNILYLPTRAGGIAYSENGGSNWKNINDGIISMEVTHVTGSPVDPAIVFASAFGGDGTYRSNNYGRTWKHLDPGGIKHHNADELRVDPVSPNNVWFIADIPYIQKSTDGGDTWALLSDPDEGGEFNFGSVYAMASSSENNSLYALNNGFGIYKGERSRIDESFDWNFLMTSEVDYSYTLAVDPTNPDIIFSGYSRKPFETLAKIMGSTDGGKNWSKLLEVNDAEAVTSVVIDPQNTSKIYAASTGDNGGSLWYSDNSGQDWQKNDYFNYTTIHSFATGGQDSPIAYAGVWGGGTYLTDDFGSSWKQLASKEVFSAAAIAIPPNDTNIIYIADRTSPVLFQSIDGGNSWNEFFNAGPAYRRLMSISIDPLNKDRIYVAAMKMGGPGKLGGLFKIENDEVTDINGILPRVPLNITIDPTNTSILYAVLHESGVYKTIDGGITWTDISASESNLPETGFNNLIIDPNNASTLYLIGGCDVRFETFESAGLDPEVVNTVYISENAGMTWTNLHQNTLGAESGGIKSLVFYNGMSSIFFLGAENGLYHTTDGGSSWIKNLDLPYNTLGGIAISDTTIYAFTNGAGVFTGRIQSDLSIQWDTVSKIRTPVYFAQILKDHSDSNVVYASGYPGGIFKSTDHGKTWHEKNFGMVSFKVEDPLRQGYYAFVQGYNDPDVLYLGLYEKGVYRSENGGDTWYQINGPVREMMDKAITSIAVDNQDDNKVYIGTENGVYSSSDGGQSWFSMNDSLVSLDVKTLYMSPGNQLYAGTRGYGLYQWMNDHWMAHDGFNNWGQFWPIWNDRPKYQYTSLLIHPEDHSRMLVGTFPQGIYKSKDGGATWKERNIGFTNDGVFSLVCHPENPEVVYAGTYNGMNRSLDFGDHWEMWDNGMPPEQWVFSIDFNPIDPDIMYACSKNGENEGDGRIGFRGTVMKSSDGGEHWVEITNGLVDKDDSLHQEFYNIIVDRFDPNTVYLTAEFGVYISRDGGGLWEPWKDGLTNHYPGTNGNNVTHAFTLSADHSMLYFGSDGSGVWRRMITPILPVNKLSARVINHEVLLKWSFADLNNSFSHYNVYRDEVYFTDITGMTPVARITSMADTFYTDANIQEGNPYFYAVTTNDTSGYENDHLYVLGPVVDYLFQIASTALDSGMVGMAYSDTLEVIGGDPPYSWEILSGTLTDGLELSAAGIIQGIPTEAGQFRFTVRASDSRQPPNTDTLICNLYVEESTGKEADLLIPGNFALLQNFPNPFNTTTMIRFELPGREKVQLEVCNFLGQKIDILVDQTYPAGIHEIEFNGEDLPPGIYFYKLTAGNFQDVKKTLLAK